MATYYVDSNATGTADGSSWANAYGDIVTALTGKVGGDVLLVSHLHNKNYAATTTYIFPTTGVVSVLCVNTGTGALAKTAIENSGAFNFTIQGNAHIYGLDIRCGSSITGTITIGNTASVQNFASCSFTLSTFGASSIRFITSNPPSYQKLSDCVFTFNNSGQVLMPRHWGITELVNCRCIGTTVTTLFNSQVFYGLFKASACDFSNATNLMNDSNSSSMGFHSFSNCKIPSSVFTGTHPGLGGSTTEIHACSSSDTVVSYRFKDGTGQIDHNTSAYLTTGGASFLDTSGSSVQLSHAMVSSANASMAFPLKSPWYNALVNTTGGKNFTVKIAYDSATALKNIDCWLEVEYMADANSPITTNTLSAPLVTGTTSLDILATGSNLTDTAEAWTGTSGWTNKKTATLTITATVNQIGWARARVCLAKASTTLYVDPKLGVT